MHPPPPDFSRVPLRVRVPLVEEHWLRESTAGLHINFVPPSDRTPVSQSLDNHFTGWAVQVYEN
jgi:hypothetical protein